MTCLKYEELKQQLKKMIIDARTMKENCESPKTKAYWGSKEQLLMQAYNEIEAAQYLAKPEEE